MIDLGEVCIGKGLHRLEAIGHSYRISCAKKLDSDDDWEVVLQDSSLRIRTRSLLRE